MTEVPIQQANRLDRVARPGCATPLIRAAQTLIAEDRTHVPILEINTQRN